MSTFTTRHGAYAALKAAAATQGTPADRDALQAAHATTHPGWEPCLYCTGDGGDPLHTTTDCPCGALDDVDDRAGNCPECRDLYAEDPTATPCASCDERDDSTEDRP